MSVRPDQLDQQVAMAVNQIRRNAREARARLGLDDVLYPTAIAEGPKCSMCDDRGYGRHTLAGPLVPCPRCNSSS